MGCGASRSSGRQVTKVKEALRAPKLIIVFDNNVDGPRPQTEVHIFNLKGCEMDMKVSLPTNPSPPHQPLTTGFTVVTHPDQPYIYIIGGQYVSSFESTENPYVWMYDLGKPDQMTRLANLPVAMYKMIACVSSKNRQEYLYLHSEKNETWRLNLVNNTWKDLLPPPVSFNKIEAFLAVDGTAYVISDGRVLGFVEEAEKENSRGRWDLSLEKLPKGLHATTGGVIYSLSNESGLMHRGCLSSEKVEEIPSFISSSTKRTVNMVPMAPNAVCCIGYPFSRAFLTVTEYYLDIHQALVAGYIDNIPEAHTAYACFC